jgi:outer membrane protein
MNTDRFIAKNAVLAVGCLLISLASAQAPRNMAPSGTPSPATRALDDAVNGPRRIDPLALAQDVRDAQDAPEITLRETIQVPIADPEETVSILEEIQIELLDLEKLSAQVAERLRAGEPLRLSLRDCVTLALEANQDLLIAVYDPLAADADVFSAKGEFDPIFSTNFNYTDSTQTAAGQLLAFGGIPSVQSWQTSADIGVRGKLKWGTQYNITFNMNRDEGSFTGFLEQFNGSLTTTLTQPLLRGRGAHVNRIRIRMAENSKAISEAQVMLTAMNSVADVIKAYWDLVGAIDSLRVTQQALENAQRLVDISQRRFEIGTAAALEVLQAKAGVASRQSDYIAAQTRIVDAEDALKRLLSLRDGDYFSSQIIVPTDRPSDIEFDWDVERSMQLALQNRPEIRSAALTIANAKLDRDRARNELLPQFDLTGGYTTGGTDHKLRETFRGVRDQQNEVYTYGFTGSIPIGNRAARGAFRRAKLTVTQAEQRLEKAKQDAMWSVRLALRNAVSSQILVESNRQATKLQEASVRAEERRLSLGTTTSQNVLDIQEDLTAAQNQEVQARINFEKALVDLQLAEGAILANLGIEFELPEDEGHVPFIASVNPFHRPD